MRTQAIRTERLPQCSSFEYLPLLPLLSPFWRLRPPEDSLSALFYMVAPVRWPDRCPPFPRSAHVSVAYSRQSLGPWRLWRARATARGCGDSRHGDGGAGSGDGGRGDSGRRGNGGGGSGSGSGGGGLLG